MLLIAHKQHTVVIGDATVKHNNGNEINHTLALMIAACNDVLCGRSKCVGCSSMYNDVRSV